MSVPEFYRVAANDLGIIVSDTTRLFPSMKEVTRHMRLLAVRCGFQIRYGAGGRDFVTWRCKISDDCPFRVSAYKRKNGVKITIVELPHNHELFTALEKKKGERNTTLSAELAVETVISYVMQLPRLVPNTPVHEITGQHVRTAIQDSYCIEVIPSYVSRVKKLANIALERMVEEVYPKLEGFMTELQGSFPECHAVVDKDSESRFLRCVFIPHCFKNCIAFCKPVIALEAHTTTGIFSKSGLYLTAAVKDGNDNVNVIALAFVRFDDEDTWTWFLTQLKTSSLKIPPKCLFLSQIKLDIVNAVKSAMPEAMHRFAVGEVFQSLKTRFKSLTQSDVDYMHALTNCSSHDEFNQMFTKLYPTKALVGDELLKISIPNWIRYVFLDQGIPTFGEINANYASEFSSIFSTTDPKGAFIQYMHHIVDIFRTRYREVNFGGPNDLVDVARTYLQELRRDARHYVVDFVSNSGEATVRHYKVPKQDMVAISIVKLRQMTCSCGLWQDLLLPCVHALAIEPQYAVPVIYLKKAPRSLYGQNLNAIEEYLISNARTSQTTAAPKAPLLQRIGTQPSSNQTTIESSKRNHCAQPRAITPSSSQSSNTNGSNDNQLPSSCDNTREPCQDENAIDLTNTPNDSEVESRQPEQLTDSNLTPKEKMSYNV